jgi:DNA-binding transcriptional regulator YhcF (GntR family)
VRARQAQEATATQSLLEALTVAIDRNADVPVGVQIAWALRARIGDGTLKPNKRLPGLHELAEAAGVNVNTARAVYQRLEREGLIDSQQGSGTFVAADLRRSLALSHIVENAAREACASGIAPRDIAAALYVVPASPTATAGADVERRRLLRRQIAALELTASELEAEHPGVAPPPVPHHPMSGPRLLGAKDLERLRGELVQRLASVQTAIDKSAEPGSSDQDGRPPSSKAVKPAKRRRARPASRPASAEA